MFALFTKVFDSRIYFLLFVLFGHSLALYCCPVSPKVNVFLSKSRIIGFPRARLFATMLPADLELPSFLRNHVHPQLGLSEKRRLHLFLGNQAADADSIVSALAMAYAAFVQHHTTPPQHRIGEEPSPVFIPIVQIQQDDLALRQEVSLLLGRVGLQLGDLVPAAVLLASPLFAHSLGGDLTLLDHNALDEVLQVPLSSEKFPVVRIVDHHADAGKHLAAAQRRVAFDANTNQAQAGSCCTLVYEAIQQLPTREEIIPRVAWPLFGVILLDTLNLDPSAKKVTPLDSDASSALMKVLSISDEERRSFFDGISNAKSDVSFWRSLSSAQCLRFDFKLFRAALQRSCPAFLPGTTVNIGMSSILLPVPEFIQKSDLMDAVETYMSALGLDFLVVMTFVSAPSPARDIAVFCKQPGGLELMLKCFEASELSAKTALNLSSSILSDEDRQSFAAKGIFAEAFHQGNLAASRKQVAPLLTNFFESP